MMNEMCCTYDVVARRGLMKRSPWTDEEQAAVRSSLAKYFFPDNRLPGKQEIEQCLERHACLSGRSWQNVKDFVRNCQLKLSRMSKN